MTISYADAIKQKEAQQQQQQQKSPPAPVAAAKGPKPKPKPKPKPSPSPWASSTTTAPGTRTNRPDQQDGETSKIVATTSTTITITTTHDAQQGGLSKSVWGKPVGIPQVRVPVILKRPASAQPHQNTPNKNKNNSNNNDNVNVNHQQSNRPWGTNKNVNRTDNNKPQGRTPKTGIIQQPDLKTNQNDHHHITTTTKDATATSWKTIASGEEKKKAPFQPAEKPRREAPNANANANVVLKGGNAKKYMGQAATAKKGNAKGVKTAHPQPTTNKNKNKNNNVPPKNSSKKPKPKLATMSIGDMMSEPPKKMGVKGSKKSGQTTAAAVQQPQQKPTTIKQLQVSSAMEFPALGAPITQLASSKPAMAWGAKMPAVAANTPPIKAVLKNGAKASIKQKQPATKSEKKKESKKEKPASTSKDSRFSAASAFFKPTEMSNRVGDGDEHQLLRLMQDRTVYQKKGRQRVAPRKKKFTALKKKVLQERLKKWRESHPEDFPGENNGAKATAEINSNTCSICVYCYASKDELEDDDEYEEIVENLRGMATKVGMVEEISIPRNLDREGNYPSFVKFQSQKDAAAAKACWGGLVVGGEALEVVHLDESVISDEIAATWSEKVLAAESLRKGTNTPVDEDTTGPTVIILEKVLTEDDYEDEDCMNESLEDLRRIAQKYGDVLDLRANEISDGSVQLTYNIGLESAQRISDSLCQETVAGEQLSANIREKSSSSSIESTIILENALTEDDLEDEDCLKETLHDIQELAGRYGEISAVSVADKAVNIVFLGSLAVAQNAIKELNGLCLGGIAVSARILAVNEVEVGDTAGEERCLYLRNILTEDDIEDADCLEESLNDVRILASKYGEIININVIQDKDSPIIKVSYDCTQAVVDTAMVEFDGMVFGGQIVTASTILSPSDADAQATMNFPNAPAEDGFTTESSGEKRKPSETEEAAAKKAKTNGPQQLYSGDKLIPERFAECKRVPKIPNATGPREYAKLVNDERVRPLLTEMLRELMRLQKRAMEDKNAKARRRLVMGLREVARGIRAHKVKMVVMANNLDEYGAIDAKLQEIIDLAHSEDVPLFFEFTKRSLGKAVGKSIKMAVVGIQNADGAHQQFKKLSSIAVKM